MSLKRKGQQKKRQKTQAFSKMFTTFAGDQLAILIKNVRGQNSGRILNVTMEGYLLDECEEYIYIGHTPEVITGAIRKTEISSVIAGGFTVNDAEVADIEIPEGGDIH